MNRKLVEFVPVKEQEQIDAVAHLAQIIWRQHYTPLIGEAQVQYMLDHLQSSDAIGQGIVDGMEYYLLSTEDTFAGYLGIAEKDGDMFLSKLYLLDSFHGKGIASSAFTFVEEETEKRQIHRLWLTCNIHNENTLAIYKKWGFRVVDTQQADIGGGYVMDDYILEKTI